MQLKQYSVNKLKQDIASICRRHLTPGYEVFFFGSRVQGTNTDRSDIDIGILGKQPVPVPAKLAIEEELDELPLLYQIDFVDFSTVSDGFKKEATKQTESIITL